MDSKVYKGYQTVIPSEIRKKLGIKPNDKITWNLMSDGTVNLNFKKQKTTEDLIGYVSSKNKTDSAKLKKQSQRGLNIDIYR
ncbi:type II toxin-antitoxin system PrlF family antitoxin [Methanobrevibacter sp. TMH8]|uniref:type II toxin-antitoxin system PrlF family antitoxin n=1 Tax=Methanobrevibacter sp. TMH8 TaxID=2848611 RepID=UPI001CCB8906|nr:type II toxin-antitoxin system PrlF family antitoxin [Methanobrevibacter sp. TMH8]MBZ9571521.1 type II toxin-antitoxin system PrlF family antitoxin [Methanobrevibacter sp. TMH8]